MSLLVAIDAPNVFNSVVRILRDAEHPPEAIVDYMRDGFDFDRLIGAGPLDSVEVGRDLGIVLFHSNKKVGPPWCSFDGKHAAGFWGRQAQNPQTSTMLVDVPGVQGKRTEKCTHCDNDLIITQSTEKGVDTSLTVFLFETSDTWKSVIIASNDADFVPVIWALRRRGKSVYVYCKQDSETALLRAAQDAMPFNEAFLNADFKVYHLLRGMRKSILASLPADVDIESSGFRLCFNNRPQWNRFLESKEELERRGFIVGHDGDKRFYVHYGSLVDNNHNAMAQLMDGAARWLRTGLGSAS